MTANNFIREFAIKLFSEAARTEDKIYYNALNGYSENLNEDLKSDYSTVAWFLGEFCDELLQKYLVDIVKEDDNGWKKVYLIEGKYVLETMIFGYDCYDNLDWKFVEKQTKMVQIEEWTEV